MWDASTSLAVLKLLDLIFELVAKIQVKLYDSNDVGIIDNGPVGSGLTVDNCLNALFLTNLHINRKWQLDFVMPSPHTYYVCLA